MRKPTVQILGFEKKKNSKVSFLNVKTLISIAAIQCLKSSHVVLCVYFI